LILGVLSAFLITHCVDQSFRDNMASNEQQPLQNESEEKKEDHCDEALDCRSIVKKFEAHSQREGAGFIVNRPIGGRHMESTESDPFLMLDELGPKQYKKGEFEGAPWHPHRGFDTVMYMKHGEGAHQDSMGNKGRLLQGDVQWMTAGSGIIHDEGRDHPGGLLHGFQMWVNLPRKHKLCDPQYQQITAKNFPFLEVADGVKCKVIAGEIAYEEGVFRSPLRPIVPIHYFDYHLESGQVHHRHVIPKEMREAFTTVIVYVYDGEGVVADGDSKGGDDSKRWVTVKRKDTLKMSESGGCIEFESAGTKDFGFLLLMGQPIQEPIAWKGPFVMNTHQEIEQCFEDYKNGKLATVKGKSVIY